jgi:antitoxin CptB
MNDDVIDERALSKLRWRCRRGLLENDLFVERFFARQGGAVTERQAAGLGALMDLADNDLLDLLLRRREPDAELASDAVSEVLALMRKPTATLPNDIDGPPRARPAETKPDSPRPPTSRNHHHDSV